MNPGSSRRRSVCTEDAREIVPPQLPFFSWERRSRPSSPSSGHMPQTMGPRPMIVDVQLAEAQTHKRRPLPIPPVPKSAPPVPPQRFPQRSSPRPLPSPPLSGIIALPVSPATPQSPPFPPTPTFDSNAHLRGRSEGSPLTAPLRLQTSPDALKPRVLETLESPATPILPELPSPRTVQRKRTNKLRRHLGESVQVVLDRAGKVDVLAGLREIDEDDYPVLDITVESVLGLRTSTDSETSSDCETDDGVDYFIPCETDDRVDYFVPSHRGSRKWMRERGKSRWTEDDFTKVLEGLRAL